MNKKNKFNIQCHCGNINVKLKTNLNNNDLPRRKCQCDFCIAHGAVWTSDSESGEVEVKIKDKKQINKYRFGTKTADFYICKICGVVPIAVSKINDNDNAVVNVNAITDPKINITKVVKTNFRGESIKKRLERRENNWIKKVEILND